MSGDAVFNIREFRRSQEGVEVGEVVGERCVGCRRNAVGGVVGGSGFVVRLDGVRRLVYTVQEAKTLKDDEDADWSIIISS